jgi:alkylation response protein AidB-like acyl-CoA dehydrogenase
MSLTLSADDAAFRDEIRAFLARALPEDIATRLVAGERPTADDIRRWQGILHANGYGAIHWPQAFGGRDASALRQYLFELECARAGAPPQLSFGVRMLAPVLMRYGTPEQQARFLPGILSGANWWCQGYSEPGAGSDLASLRTQAVLDGDHYVVNGQKCWNTLGQYADWMFCLVRTDPTAKPQRGISMLLIDMKTPGITVRPTVLLDGTPEVNDIFLENVRVPVSLRVGAENDGWTYAKFLLSHERANIGGVPGSKRDLARLRALATTRTRDGSPLLEHPDFRARLTRVEVDLLALELMNLRVLSASERDPFQRVGPSMLKIRGSLVRQAISALYLDVLGPEALAYTALDDEAPPAYGGPAGAAGSYLNLRKLSIFGGSNEIQRNIIAQSLLGATP